MLSELWYALVCAETNAAVCQKMASGLPARPQLVCDLSKTCSDRTGLTKTFN